MNRWPLIAMENTLFADRSLGWSERCATIAAAGFDGVYAIPAAGEPCAPLRPLREYFRESRRVFKTRISITKITYLK